MLTREALVYFVLFHFTQAISLTLHPDERILSVTQTGIYRQVWIEGTEESASFRFGLREEGVDRTVLMHDGDRQVV